MALRGSDAAALVVYAGTPVRVPQVAALVPYTYDSSAVRASQVAALVPYISLARAVRASDAAALVVYAAMPNNAPIVSDAAALVVWGVTDPASENRTRAWSFVLDGHRFYVLDLGQEGTWLYDLTTQQWSQWETAGFIGWNMRAGTMWQVANRIVAADTLYGDVWEMTPTDVDDESFRTITHVVTGGLMTRNRVSLSVDALRVAGSIGFVQDDLPGVTFNMRFSDDNGNTWSDYFSVLLVEGEWGGEIAYRSLGSFHAPGRVFEFSDAGGLLRIDGSDVFINDFDDQSEKSG